MGQGSVLAERSRIMGIRLFCTLSSLGLFLALPLACRGDDDLAKFVEQNRLLARR